MLAPREKWSDTIRQLFPSWPAAVELVDAVQASPGLETWLPSRGLASTARSLIEWGFLLAITQRFDGIDRVQRAIADEIRQFDRPARKTLSELSGAALCIALGATGGARISHEKGIRTPDWLLHFEPNCLVEVEVSAADPKVDQLDRSKSASLLAEELHAEGRMDDVVAYIVDPTITLDRNAAMEAASRIGPGEMLQVLGHWQVRAQVASIEPDVIFTNDDLRRPEWWPAQERICGVSHTGIDDGPPARRIAPRISVFFAVSDETLLTTLRTKAERSQATLRRPMLLAIDISLLPNGMQKLPAMVVPFFPQWNHVAGILLFEQWHPDGRIGWRWRLLANSHADLQLPVSFTDGNLNRAGTSTREFLLSSEEPILQPE